MKIISVIAILLAFGCSGNRKWSAEDTYRQAAFITIASVDWGQTRNIANNPDKYYEMNPILGSHPSTGEVDMYFAASIAAHTAVAASLPHGWREVWQYAWIGLEFGTVAHNYGLGIKMDF